MKPLKLKSDHQSSWSRSYPYSLSWEYYSINQKSWEMGWVIHEINKIEIY